MIEMRRSKNVVIFIRTILRTVLKQFIWNRLKVKKTNWHDLLYSEVSSFVVTRKCQKIRDIGEIVNIDGGNLHITWKASGISMKCLGKMWPIIILKSQNTGLHSSSTTFIFGKTTRRVKVISPSLFRVK